MPDGAQRTAAARVIYHEQALRFQPLQTIFIVGQRAGHDAAQQRAIFFGRAVEFGRDEFRKHLPVTRTPIFKRAVERTSIFGRAADRAAEHDRPPVALFDQPRDVDAAMRDTARFGKQLRLGGIECQFARIAKNRQPARDPRLGVERIARPRSVNETHRLRSVLDQPVQMRDGVGRRVVGVVHDQLNGAAQLP